MIEDGLVELDGDELIVTEAGRPIVRVVAAAFDSFRRPQSAQFSRAI
jgi:oxygen-independent coproporphyrinogen-3 oxidase